MADAPAASVCSSFMDSDWPVIMTTLLWVFNDLTCLRSSRPDISGIVTSIKIKAISVDFTRWRRSLGEWVVIKLMWGSVLRIILNTEWMDGSSSITRICVSFILEIV